MKSFARFFSAISAALLAMLIASYPGTAAAKSKDSSKNKSSDNASANQQPTPTFNVPIPIDHDAHGIRLPYFDSNGKLQMFFTIDSARRTDNNHLQMNGAAIQTYDETGAPEMDIEMPRSVLDLNTRIVQSDAPVSIRRSDFEVVGERMVFNTQTRSGVMIGRVRMLIYNREQSLGDTGKESAKQ